jgi:hypothetical protein
MAQKNKETNSQKYIDQHVIVDPFFFLLSMDN